ncbi:MAG TPA: hypothetical protein VFS07_05005 [Gemmatimonadales bacterium]|nr:hypothetical protein [Gemmatimonadales bacterium]
MRRSRYLAGAALALALASACDTVTEPVFGAGCQQGTLHPGDTVIAAFTTASCQMELNIWSYSRTPYAGYAVHLTRGHAYMFRLDPIPDPADPSSRWVDALLALWGKNAEGNSVPLAMSDDDAGDRNSVLWFVAPVSGTFELVASSCWYDELGGYRLTMHECPVLGALDTAGTYTFTLAASPCIRPKAYTTQDTAAYSFLTFPAAPGEAVNVSVDAAAFPPVWELSAPGFDTYAYVYDASRYSKTKGIGNTAGFTMGAVGGLVTLAVGATTVDSTSGTFSLTLTRTPSPAPPAGAAQWSVDQAPLMARKAPPLKTH